MTDVTAAQVEELVRAGKWLAPPALAVLFGVDRGTVYRWAVKKHLLGFEKDPTSRVITCNPEDVLKLLAAKRRAGGAQPG